MQFNESIPILWCIKTLLILICLNVLCGVRETFQDLLVVIVCGFRVGLGRVRSIYVVVKAIVDNTVERLVLDLLGADTKVDFSYNA